MMEKDETVFYSKIDWWLIAVMFLGFIAAAHIFYLSPVNNVLGVIFILFLITAIHAIFSCKYIFRKDYLYVRAGIFAFLKIPYKDIKGFSDSRCLLSAPAFSLDRIKINYGGKIFGIQKFTLVSPKDKNLFKEILAEKTAETQKENV